MLLDKQGTSIRSSTLKHHKLQKCTDEVDATLHKTLEKNKILREPRLKLPKDIINKEHRTIKMSKSTSVYQEDVKTELFENTDTENSTLVYKDNIEVETISKGTACGIARSCSFEFKNRDHYGAQGFNAIDDTSPEELAAYFEQLLHIPKPMSSMAEMMYT